MTFSRLSLFLTLVSALAPAPAWALEHVTFSRNDKTRELSGRIVVEAEDGGLLLQTADGAMFTIEPQEITRRSTTEEPFAPLSADALAKAMLRDLPEGFEVHQTAHYVVCYNTSRAYAQWCGSLFERLYMAFTNYWSRKGFKLREPEFPFVAVVFADAASYRRFASAELGEAASAIVGYYSLGSNRVTMYDLTGVEALRQPGIGRGSTAEINRMLSQPDAEPMVATIVHEATHQIAFNTGLQTRFADIPVWVSEGIAVYFETPDLSSSKGWRGIGAVNRSRLSLFQRNRLEGKTPGLQSLLADDKRIRDPKTALGAYADAWALNYYLLKQRPKEYVAYLQMLSEKGPLIWDEPAERLADFRKFFGQDLAGLEADLARQMRGMK